jgi:membrane fusion protein (multidrug efflux system)
VEASERVEIVSEIDALVDELPFVEGAFVAKGRVLARLRDTDIRAGVERARALRDEAKVAHDRLSRLTDELVVSRQEQDTAAAKLAVAEADLRVAEVQLRKTRVVAPFAGLLSRRLVSPGAYLRAGDPIVELAAIDEVKVAFTVPERNLAALRLGSGVLLESVSYPGEKFAGAIAVIDPLVDPTTRSARVIARIANPERKLRPGLSAAVSVPLAERSSALTVPEEAVVAEGDTNFVFRIGDDATVEKRPVTLGMRQGGKVEVLSGLEGGDRVVRAGHQKLFPGAKVTASGEAEAGATATGDAGAGDAEAPENGATTPGPE